MATDSTGGEDARRGRFSRSGHTSHEPRGFDPAGRAPNPQPTIPQPTDPIPAQDYPAPQGEPVYQYPPGGQFSAYSPPTLHGKAPKPGKAKRAVAGSTGAVRSVSGRVIAASKANGAHESGLTALIWNQVLSFGADAMITVALAGTVFFGASTHAQRGNVLLYLLVTMAPFAVVAPIIGPALDRWQHGRRIALAATAFGRTALALVMAAHSNSLLFLYPCALGSLVLSKAYSVIRASAAPRLVPENMTLVEANARLSIFSLGSAIVGGAFVGGVIKLSGSYTAGLVVTAIAFAVCGFFALRLPRQVDSDAPAARHPEEPKRPRTQLKVPTWPMLVAWANRGMDPQVVTALQGESALRYLSGMLTIYMAFTIEATNTGVAAAMALGAVGVGVGAGNFTGTFVGTRVRPQRPELLINACVGAAALCCLLVALTFNLTTAVLAMYITAALNSLSKIALDAVIQRDVAETFRSSAFGRSETFLQLSWVTGAALACVLPADNGQVGFWVAGTVMTLVAVVVYLRNRVIGAGPVPPRTLQAPTGPLA